MKTKGKTYVAVRKTHYGRKLIIGMSDDKEFAEFIIENDKIKFKPEDKVTHYVAEHLIRDHTLKENNNS